jgi:hypothetical protein
VARRLRGGAPGEPRERADARKRLIDAGRSAVSPATGLVRDRSVPEESRLIALDALVQISRLHRSAAGEIQKLLMQIMGDRSEPIALRLTAIRGLRGRTDSAFIAAVERALDSPEAPFRSEAVAALALADDLQAQKAILRLFADPDAEARSAAVQAFVQKARGEAAPHLVPIMVTQLREVGPGEARTIVGALSQTAKIDFELEADWHLTRFHETLRKVEARLKAAGYVIPPDGAEALPAEMKQVPEAFRWVAAQRARGKIVVTLEMSDRRGDPEGLMTALRDLAAKWQGLPGVESAEAYGNPQWVRDAQNEAAAYFYVRIAMK